MANSKEVLLAALSCVTQGAAPKGRYEYLNRGTANLILQGAIDELVDLRCELHELYCRECNIMYPSPTGKSTLCPVCNAQMMSMAHAQLRSTRNQVRSLEERLARLEITIEVLSDLSD